MANSESNKLVTMDRRRGERRDVEASIANEAGTPRRKKQRRRQIDPTTCEREYSSDEREFMQAIDSYKRKSGRMFPTCSEILEVIRDLGYVKVDSVIGDTVNVDNDDLNSGDEADILDDVESISSEFNEEADSKTTSV